MNNKKKLIENILNSELSNEEKTELLKYMLSHKKEAVKEILLALNLSVELLKLFNVID